MGKRNWVRKLSAGRSRSTGVGVSSRSPSSGSFLSGFLPLANGDNLAVEGPAVELEDDKDAGESLCRRIELRHEHLESAECEAMLLTRLLMFLGLMKLRIFLRMSSR